MADRIGIFQAISGAGVSRRTVTGMLAACAPITSGVIGPAAAQQTETASGSQDQTMKMRIIMDDRTLTATLAENPTARDFASLLPLTLTLSDYASTEKISYLPRKLHPQGAPDGIDPTVGDIAYYAPWGNLAIFHQDFRYSPGLIRLGVIDAGTDVFARPGSMKVTIELVGN
jgi:hypothetical protein